ncbi:MAG: chemotaxis protein CheA [Thermodesulfobacteriota bacterium]
MPSEESPLRRRLDELSLALVMLDPENLISLGEILEKAEKLAEAFSPLGSAEADLVLSGVRKTIEAIILEKTKDKNQAAEVVNQGVGLLQEIERSLSAGAVYGGDLSKFLAGLKSSVNIELTPPAGPAQAQTPAPATEETRPQAQAETDEAASREKKTEPPVEVAYEASQDQDLFFGFISESLEHIESIEVNLVSLEQEPENVEIINAVFRPFHTIKGVSGFLNLKEVHILTHDVENLLDDARNERLKVTPALIDLILDAVDLLKKMITDLKFSAEKDQAVTADYRLPAFIERIKTVRQAVPLEEPVPAVSPYSGLKLGQILIEQGLITEEELERLLQAQQVSRLRRLGEMVVERGALSPPDLEEALRLQLERQDKKLGEILIETGKTDPRIISQVIQEQENLREQKLGELLIREKQAEARDVAAALREQKRPPDQTGAAVSQTVKVDTLKLDSVVDLVGELVIAQSLISSNDKIFALKDQKLIRDLGHMSRITSDLQRTAMSMRMVEVRQTFQKMIRLVRDLSRKSGKLVELDLSGEDTEIDRNMVEAISDPLVHMVRNSVDHGIELPEHREKKGKPPVGRIHLKAFHQGGNVVIQIMDDGQGLNRDKILAKAVEKGLVSPDDSISEASIYNLIFQPGFSTADKVTDVSGRGVGMDVVKKTIEKLRGKVEISSRLGQGSTITIRLPLTLAIIDGMIIRVGDNRYILPTVAIRESFRPNRTDFYTVKNQGEMIKVRRNLLPLVRLGHLLGAAGAVADPSEALVVVVENEGEQRCILVDEVLGKQEVVIKSLGERLKHIKALAGGSILGDGRVGLILDVAGLFVLSDGMSGGGPISGREETGGGDWDMDGDWGMGPA